MIASVIVAAALVGGAAISVGAAAGVDGGPPLTVPAAVMQAALSCTNTRSAGHRPVLLVHGTGLTPSQSWAWNYGLVLPRLGYPTCTVALPSVALGDIQVASEYVVHAVDAMAARWRSPVDIIGHSQGGIEPRWALAWWPGLRFKVDHYIGLASPNHGIVLAGICADLGNCWPAVWQMGQASRFIAALNGHAEAPGPASYTDIYSLTDDLVQPALPTATSALTPAANVANIAVQSVCPGRYVNHGGMLADAAVFALVRDALDHAGPAQASRVPPLVCAQLFMPGVSAGAAPTGNAGVYFNAASAFAAHPAVRTEPALAPYAHG